MLRSDMDPAKITAAQTRVASVERAMGGAEWISPAVSFTAGLYARSAVLVLRRGRGWHAFAVLRVRMSVARVAHAYAEYRESMPPATPRKADAMNGSRGRLPSITAAGRPRRGRARWSSCAADGAPPARSSP